MLIFSSKPFHASIKNMPKKIAANDLPGPKLSALLEAFNRDQAEHKVLLVVFDIVKICAQKFSCMYRIVSLSIKFRHKQKKLVDQGFQLASGTCGYRCYLGSQHLTGMITKDIM